MINDKYLLKTTDLAIGFESGNKPVPILDNINIGICGGELVCLMGPNGIGKSTLIRTLCGLQQQMAGEVFLSGRSLQDISAVDRSKLVSVVLTDRVQGGNLTVSELINMGRYPHMSWFAKLTKDDEKIISNAIETIDLSDILDRKLYQLSDGQLQRAMIARALVQDGNVMILDEPTAHLDLNNRLEVMKLLRSLAHDFQKGVLIATHELDLALQLSDRLLLAQSDGRILSGIPEDLILGGQLDDTFKLKGYDLKTGKAELHPTQSLTISISAQGYFYLWTKNAVERNGYLVVDSTEKHDVLVEIESGDQDTYVVKVKTPDNRKFHTLEGLIMYLKSI